MIARPTHGFTLLALTLALLCGGPSRSAAQEILRGYVVDAGGAALPGVNVYLPSTYEGAVTDSLGHFSFAASAKTPFTVAVAMMGYRPDSLVVVGGANAELRFRIRETAAALSEIVVTAGAFVASDTRKTAVLSSVDVATTGAQADLAEALSTLPGSTPAGESGQLLVRGGAAAETQAYINNLRVPRLYSSNLPDVPSRTRFSPFAFRGITFATGGFSAAYGDALSGALILQTQDLPERNLTSVSLMTLGGSVGRTQKICTNRAVAFDFGGTHLGPYARLNAEARRVLTRAPQGLSGNFAYWWNGRDGRNLRVFAQAGTQHFTGDNAVERPYYGVTRRSLDNVNAYAQAVYQQPAAGQGLWEIGTAVATNHDRFGGDADVTELDQTDLQLRTSYADQLGELALWRAGIEGQFRREAVGKNIPEMTRVAELDRGYVAGFAEADWFLASRWVLRTGLRTDSYDGCFTSVSPRLQLSHLFSATHQLALSAGQYRQRQSDDQVFARDLDLRPASLDQVGLTYSRTWSGRVLRAEAYAKTYRDLLTNRRHELGTRGNGYARGLDIFFRDRTTVRNADFWVSYSFTDAARLRDSLVAPAPVPYTSQHNVAVVAKRFFPGPSLGLSATYRWHAGRAFDDPNSAVRFDGVTPDFHDLSLNVTYLTNIRGHFTVVFASLTNVTGARQVNQYRYALEPSAQTGRYDRIAVDPLFPSFPFVGMFVSIGDKGRVGGVDDI